MNLLKTTALGLILTLGLITPQAHAMYEAADLGDQDARRRIGHVEPIGDAPEAEAEAEGEAAGDRGVEDAERRAFAVIAARRAAEQCITETTDKITALLKSKDNAATCVSKIRALLADSKLEHNPHTDARTLQSMIMGFRKGTTIGAGGLIEALELTAPTDEEALIRHFYAEEEPAAAPLFLRGAAPAAALHLDIPEYLPERAEGIFQALQGLYQQLVPALDEEQITEGDNQGLQNIRGVLGGFEDAYQTLNQENRALRDLLITAQGHIAGLERQAGTAADEATRAHRDLEAKEEICRALQEQGEGLRRDYGALKEALGIAERDLKEIRGEYDVTRRALEAANAAGQVAGVDTKELEKLQGELRRTRAQILQMQRDQAENPAESELRRKLIGLETDKHQVEQVVLRLQEENQGLDRTLTAEMEKVASVEAFLKDLSTLRRQLPEEALPLLRTLEGKIQSQLVSR